MSRNNKIRILIILVALLALGLIYYVFFYTPEKRYVWAEDYKNDKERPFGTWLMAELLKHYPPKRDFVELGRPPDQSLQDAETPSNYVFIGQEIYLENTYADNLLNYVEAGNNAFIFTEEMPWLIQYRLLKYIRNNEQEALDPENDVTDSGVTTEEQEDEPGLEPYSFYLFDTIYAEVTGGQSPVFKGYRFVFRYKNSISKNRWTFVREDNLEKLNPEILGYFYGINSEGDTLGQTNYYRMKYGKGYFYFHTQPLLFSNIMLLDSAGPDYANEVFAWLNNGTIYWEEHNWLFNRPTSKTRSYMGRYGNNRESPLKFILSNPPLKWGWYLLLVFIFLFIIFEGKRKQQVIPVISGKENTTLEHIKTLSKLYHRSGNHYSIVRKMFENFLWFLRAEMQIDTTRSPEKIIDQVSLKSGVKRKEIESIFNLYQNIEKGQTAGDKVFYELYNKLDAFYSMVK